MRNVETSPRTIENYSYPQTFPYTKEDYLVIREETRNGKEYWVVNRMYVFPEAPFNRIFNYDDEIYASVGWNQEENLLHFRYIYYPKSFINEKKESRGYTLSQVETITIKLWNCPNCTTGVTHYPPRERKGLLPKARYPQLNLILRNLKCQKSQKKPQN